MYIKYLLATLENVLQTLWESRGREPLVGNH